MARPEVTLESIGARVRRVRKMRGISGNELARRVKVSGDTISFLERGIHGTNMFTFIDIAKELGVSVDYLAYGSNYGIFNGQEKSK